MDTYHYYTGILKGQYRPICTWQNASSYLLYFKGDIECAIS